MTNPPVLALEKLRANVLFLRFMLAVWRFSGCVPWWAPKAENMMACPA
jgi:hypothetical protein